MSLVLEMAKVKKLAGFQSRQSSSSTKQKRKVQYLKAILQQTLCIESVTHSVKITYKRLMLEEPFEHRPKVSHDKACF